MYCQYCGHQNNAGSKYCEACGKPTSGTVSSTLTTATKPIKMKVAPLVIGVGVVIAILGIWSLSSSDQNATKNPVTSSTTLSPFNLDEIHRVVFSGGGMTQLQKDQFFAQQQGKRVKLWARVHDVSPTGEVAIGVSVAPSRSCAVQQDSAVVTGIPMNVAASLKRCDHLEMEATLHLSNSGYSLSFSQPTIISINPTPAPTPLAEGFCDEILPPEGTEIDGLGGYDWPVDITMDIKEGITNIPQNNAGAIKLYLLRLPLTGGSTVTVGVEKLGYLIVKNPADTQNLTSMNPIHDGETKKFVAPCTGTYHLYYWPSHSRPGTVTVTIR